MMVTKTKPITFTGEGSAIENYLSPKNIILEGGRSVGKSNWAIFDKNNPKHKVILSIMYQAEWTTSHQRHLEVPDMNRLSEFLKSEKSPVNKPLKDMTSKELEKIITALNGIVKSKYK